MNEAGNLQGDNIPSNLRDASRTALAAIRFIRAGNEEALCDLVSTLDSAEQAQLCGALASLANASLLICDQMADELDQVDPQGGKGRLRGDDILRLIAVSMLS